MRIEELPFGFWVPNGRLGVGEAQLRAAEAFLARQLPKELAKALMIQDGGVSVYSGFRRGDYYVPIPALFSLEQLLHAEKDRAEFGTPEGVVAIASGAHEWLGLDYREKAEPSVVFQEFEQAGVETVANSFEELLEGLVED